MITTEELIAANPFPGLRSFTRGEADLFFGRGQQIEDLVGLLAESSLIAVAGASGCGKSSLVLAGLLNRLALQRAAGGAVDWRPVVLRPGNHPIRNLAEGLAIVLPGAIVDDENRAATLEGRLRLGGRGLVEAVRHARLESDKRLLVVVDQFEEIFRFRRMTDPEEASAFVKLLLHAARDPNRHISVVLTLRSDALGFCAEFRDLPEAINRGQYLVPRLTREQRREAIVKPAELRGFKVAPRLVQRILNDITDDFDDLPVMQHVLSRTWQHWATACGGTQPIDLGDYEATGGAADALSSHAEEAYGSLDGLAAVVARVFRALTERGTGGIEIRRPLRFVELCEVTGSGEVNIEQVVERFRRSDTAFLMPSPEVALATNPVIDISHESLIRLWRRLREWTRCEAESRAELLRLVEAARLYDQKEGDLWRGRDLSRGLEWRRREEPTAPWVGLCTGGDGASAWTMTKTFLAESERAVHLERRQRLLRRLQSLTLTIIAVAVVATLAAAFVQDKAKLRSKSSELASRALIELWKDPARSAHLALAAMDQDPHNESAESVLRQSITVLDTAYAERVVSLGEPIADARFTSDGSQLVVASQNHVRVFNARSYEPGRVVERGTTVTKAWLIANNTLLVTLTEDGQGQIQAVDEDPVRLNSCNGAGNFIYALAVSADEQHLAAGCFHGEIAMWDVSRAGAQRQPSFVPGGADSPTVTALAFSPDNKYLASGDAAGTVNIWKLGQAEPWIGAGQNHSKKSPIQHSGVITDITFHPSHFELLATASDDGTAIVWKLDLPGRRLAKDERTKWTLTHDRPVNRVQFTPRTDDVSRLMTISDKRVYFWRDENSREMRWHDDWVRDANVSPDGELVASASDDGLAKVWSTRNAQVIAVLRGHRSEVTRAFFGPSGEVVTTSMDGSLRVWRVRPPLVLASSSGWMLSAAFDPTGKRIALSGEGQCRIIEPQEMGRRSKPPDEEELESPGRDTIALISWSADGRFVLGHRYKLGRGQDLRLILWDAHSRRIVTPKWFEQWRTAAFSAGTRELVTVKSDGTVAVWDTANFMDANPQPKHQFAARPGRWWAEVSPDGRWIAAIEGSKVALLDPTKPESAPRMLEGHRGDIRSAKFSRDSRFLVTASIDRTARVWRVDRASGQSRDFVELTGGHTAALSSAAFSDDGQQVVTSSADHTIRVWDARSGRQLGTLRWHSEGVDDVHFSADGRSILSASDDGTVKLGRCAECNQTAAQLRELVREEAALSTEDSRKLQTESVATTFFLQFAASLSKDR